MQVATTSASVILGGTASAAATSATETEADQGVLKLQRAAVALQQMRQTLANSEDEAKAKAQRKLDEAKQQLEMLKSSNMPPEIVARLAAELARKVGTAASEFAAAVATGSPATAVPADAATDPAAAATSGAEAALTDTTAETAAPEPTDAAEARKAYESTVEESPKFSGISADDRESMEEFKEIVHELKQLLDKAMRELRQQDRQAGAYTSADIAAFSTGAAAIPTSIVV
ncbi:hypothetical protein ATY76_17980 [Rhizobium sp. R339]|uniref:hypothetical protein n=1 Tax=Rhizobium sp. R339 TaxID=1764273 RepID=UPI000B532D70|nr:hypothetical protein [Rhizobium sp. R339]OWV66393.1 hypothetical protein ATY76_17980 [Rhizobium sp. R339]